MTNHLQEARKHLEWLNKNWPWDGWDGAADARAAHHQRVIAQEKLIAELERESQTQ